MQQVGGRKQGKELQAGQNSADPNSHIHLQYTKLSKPNTVERWFKNKLVTTEKSAPSKIQTTNNNNKKIMKRKTVTTILL